MKDFIGLRRNLKKDFGGFKKIRIALLGDSSTQFIREGLKGFAYDERLDPEIYEAEYNQIGREISDYNSMLYQFAPDYIIIFSAIQKLKMEFYHSSLSQRNEFAKGKIELVTNYYKKIIQKNKAKIIFFNYPEIDDNVFGNYSNKISNSFLFQLRKLNYELMCLASENKNLYICDTSTLVSRYGKSFCFSAKHYYNSDLAFSLDFIPHIVKNIFDIILAIEGRFRKCLILDLDNTLWGGIIGDDGMDNIQIGELGIGRAFTDLQTWAKEMQNRGVILAICSKNDIATAKEPFEKHPDMVLRMENIAVFIANWNNKVDNIYSIQSILNIGFDSMVFLDDNPFERGLVRESIPEVLVPELPTDPTDYLNFISSLNLFETASHSETDLSRTEQYQQEAKRVEVQKFFESDEDFLKDLGMVSTINRFNNFNIPRIAQLSQRSNQFNLRTVRFTEEEILSLRSSDQFSCFAFDLNDKFGEYGLISVIILEKKGESLFFNTWIMSCRVLKRGMEQFVLDYVVKYAVENGFKELIGEYIATPKNAMVKDHYKNLGFEVKDSLWRLDVNSYHKEVFFIEKVDNIFELNKNDK